MLHAQLSSREYSVHLIDFVPNASELFKSLEHLL